MSILSANGRFCLDTFSTGFINTFWAPSAVTIAWLMQYGMIDAICVGASRNYFKWGFPRGPEDAPDPLRRAMRVHANQVENSNHMLFSMWLCALCGLPGFAAGCGIVWVALRNMYGFTYRMTKGSLKAILKFTFPSYALVQALYFRVTQRILSVAFDIDELKSYVIAGAGLAAINLFTLGTAMCQRKHCEIWDKNLKRDS
ncbi:hypothetical protein Pmar_PMAR012001 [Perkinsus marinus ATCC 50983]|uniref:Uncharacterized protein n=1 Tax=Perkinsus marinus (strain ATCC 50983 / TXsc) TaxID=423536 RepID=C5LW56_PERM5|nr:hypothetical protein Pmar_PMAR012001 [Perkinsus marinus ATCC 50983]EEQ98993.1 hypothetical protein Pmar_PMAR012001 [Perkinsus marinus ATCC 50983]|eukprot:XP_002766276.1 hypothetical protein Pmar_PMAR012001 [Perkinsus marinus ATCC 50983]